MSVQTKTIETGLLFDQSDSFYPTRMYGHAGGKSSYEEKSSYYFGFVVQGEVKVETAAHSQPFPLQEGMYFGLSGPFKIQGNGKVAVIERLGYRGFHTFGGPVEKEGRLLYIDRCRTSLLLPPARLGDPCLNLLTFPRGIQQTQHIHPTVRLGIVSSGSGSCVMPDAPPLPLEPGKVFMIAEGATHSFHTTEGPMSVIAFHPDTDWGPSDESHPMLNRTYRKI